MKGFVFSLGGDKPIDEILTRGLFGVWQPNPYRADRTDADWRRDRWSREQISTFADYLTINPGDLIFFFRDRMIYGIAEAISLEDTPGGNCALLNYPDSHLPSPADPNGRFDGLITKDDEAYWKYIRVVVPFVPSPLMFKEGIDMDEVLGAPGCEFFWGLRFWQGFSFKQLTSHEASFLKEAFMRRFANADNVTIAEYSTEGEKALRTRLRCKDYGHLSLRDLVLRQPDAYFNDYGGRSERFRYESMLKGLLIEHIRRGYDSLGPLSKQGVVDVYHELAASPPKPPVWADKIDIMVAARYSADVDIHVTYDIIELKIDEMSVGPIQTFDKQISQLMKYVDFISSNWCGGNYGAVRAFYIARGYSRQAIKEIEMAKERGYTITRNYVLNPRERQPTRKWDGLNFLKYEWNHNDGLLMLKEFDS